MSRFELAVCWPLLPFFALVYWRRPYRAELKRLHKNWQLYWSAA